MKSINLEQNSDEWRSFREGKISGTKLGKLYAKSRKAGELFDTTKPNLQFYQVLAERLAIGTADGIEGISAMERGHTLEAEALQAVSERLSIEFQSDGVWQDNENPNYICSPDGYSKDLTKAVEIKCLSSANHIKAIYEDERPSDYDYQVYNYFMINPRLEVLYFAMYDPRFFSEELQLKIFEVTRADIQYELERMEEVRNEAEQAINKFIEIISF